MDPDLHKDLALLPQLENTLVLLKNHRGTLAVSKSTRFLPPVYSES